MYVKQYLISVLFSCFAIIPRNIGEVLVEDITSGKQAKIKGIMPFELTVYLHQLQMRVINKEVQTMVAIADSDDVPVVLGRFEALDSFDIRFLRGKEVVIE